MLELSGTTFFAALCMQVFFVDYGNESDVDLSLLRPISSESCELPCQAVHCKHAGFTAWPAEKWDSFGALAQVGVCSPVSRCILFCYVN